MTTATRKQNGAFAYEGTLIRATLRTEDLIPSFVDALYVLANANDDNAATKRRHLRTCHQIRIAAAVEGYFDTEDAAWDLNEVLFEALNEYAPDGFYFGAHYGDGSDFGFWEEEDEET